VAVEHFLRLLRREDTGVAGSQNMILEDMALAYEVSFQLRMNLDELMFSNLSLILNSSKLPKRS